MLDYSALLGEIDELGERLGAQGIGRGDRVGVRVPSGTADLYVTILAILSVGAAYVPIDVDDPDGRAEQVWSEAGVCAVIGRDRAVSLRPVPPGGAGPQPPVPSDDAWIIFTSGSTGKPKGVAVSHGSAAAFVDAEARLFLQDEPLGPGDRVLAGLSVAFDASCEEMWLAWRHGACLVPAPRSLVKAGADLGGWLVQRQISVVSTVPTLAALWPTDQLGGIRLLIFGGEACPAELANRLAALCPEVWNTYGPTETTVVACAARMSVDEPVRIGLPLDGWQLAVVDPDSRQPVEWGEVGELVIGGVGTARYLDPEKDAAKFRPLPALGWDRAYCSGDLVRADPEGLGFVGRADTQVKVRGYRIELSEIESVLLQVPGIVQAVVTTYEPQPGLVELVGYYSSGSDAVAVDQHQVYQRLRSRLPAHMVPAYLEELAVIPTMTSGKADRKKLPAPSGRRGLADRQVYVAPATATETILAEALAEVLGLDQVSVDSHFFDDLGANSLLTAHFCARARKRAELPPLAMQDVYLHPTVRDLAAALQEAAPADRSEPAEPADPVARVGTAQYVLCGALQLLILLGVVCAGSLVLAAGLRWVWPAPDAIDLYLRSAAFGAATFLVFSTVPIVAKWVLIGRWRPQEIRIWSLAYVRFWAVKTLIRSNPLVMFRGSPLYVLYLKALGAKIGRGVVIFPRSVPVCTDLLTIGDGTIIRKDASFSGYRAHAGVIRTGTITLGRNVLVGEGTVIDIGTSMGDDAQLGHSSSLHCSQAVPNGESWHGSPAQPTDVDYRTVGPARCGTLRRAAFGAVQLVNLLLLAPLMLTAALLVFRQIPQLVELMGGGPLVVTRGMFYLNQLAISFVLFFGAVLARPRPRGHDAEGPPPRARRAGQGLSAVRFPLLDLPDHRAHDQRAVLHEPLRRQLLHHELPAGTGVQAVPVRADRVELRRRAEARDAVPGVGRHRYDHLRRHLVPECRLLEHVLPHPPGLGRCGQFLRERDHLSVRRQGWRQLPGRDEDDDPGRRSGPRERRAARLAVLRDPTVRAARQQARPVERGVPPPSRRQEPVQHRHDGDLPARAVDPDLRHHADRLRRRGPRRARNGRHRRRRRRQHHVQLGVHACSSNAPLPGSGPCGRSTARSTNPTSGGTSATGSSSRSRGS